MRYFFDTEFFEHPDPGQLRVELISLALVSEHGDRAYIVNEQRPVDAMVADEFHRNNTLPNLFGHVPLIAPTMRDVGELVARFVDETTRDRCRHPEPPEFWAWYGAYDWALFCRCFDGLRYLPTHYPKFFHDLRCFASSKALPEQPKTHNALDDALWLRDAYDRVAGLGGFR